MQLKNGYLYTEKVFLVGADPMSIGFRKMNQLLEIIHQYLPYLCMRSHHCHLLRILLNIQ